MKSLHCYMCVLQCLRLHLPLGMQGERSGCSRWMHLHDANGLEAAGERDVTAFHWQRLVSFPHEAVVVADHADLEKEGRS